VSRGARARNHGSALVGVLVLSVATVAVVSALADVTRQVAAEVRVRREAQCARFAALGGLALGPSPTDRADAIGAGVESLRIVTLLRAPGWCVVRSSARCGDAERTLERTVDPALCI
jgi:hypothetical protein